MNRTANNWSFPHIHYSTSSLPYSFYSSVPLFPFIQISSFARATRDNSFGLNYDVVIVHGLMTVKDIIRDCSSWWARTKKKWIVCFVNDRKSDSRNQGGTPEQLHSWRYDVLLSSGISRDSENSEGHLIYIYTLLMH